ncbi:hypothetical protein [Clostridium kluyveri]|uniref:Uncharacterized protein n=1 Tax=Clostridium kluyveri TaxID=1534 RepID=A0A1L5FB08_CLOKL|nr:hypothetical protein [Clostridium kluyveri]APM40196.1 hypothetical protein BS101_16345 [Clostridium kluyveri]UZQ49549.1 hypothetical protein OP486_16575 [Clostridium kluyveri]
MCKCQYTCLACCFTDCQTARENRAYYPLKIYKNSFSEYVMNFLVAGESLSALGTVMPREI